MSAPVGVPNSRRNRWTRAECATLEADGRLDQEPLELVEGDLISRIGKKRPHVISVNLTLGWLAHAFGWRFVNTGAPIDVALEDNPTNEPVPDLIVVNQDQSLFRSNPRPEQLRLVVEIADSSVNFDLGVKAALYARARVVEYWVLDITGRRLIVHRNPQSGWYADVVVYGEHECVSPLAAPDAQFCVADAFPTGA